MYTIWSTKQFTTIISDLNALNICALAIDQTCSNIDCLLMNAMMVDVKRKLFEFINFIRQNIKIDILFVYQGCKLSAYLNL